MLDKNFWKKYFEVYDVLNIVIPYQELLKTLCNKLDVKTGDLILDVGSGTGNLAILLKERGARVIGIDFSQVGLECHKRKDITAEVICCDIVQQLPFQDNYFDRIVSNNVLYTIHPEKRIEVMKELHRVLKPEGKIVISNIKEGWKPFVIYFDHIKKEYMRVGLIKLFFKILKMIIPTIKMFYFNAKINKEGSGGGYGFMKQGGQKTLLENVGFIKVSQDELVYTKQAILNFGFKSRYGHSS